jgi:Sulfotransferase domain
MISQLRHLRYKLARTKLRDPLTIWQHRGLKSQDVYLASFGRSGSTWLRFVLLEILTGNTAEFLNVHDVIPEIGMKTNVQPILRNGGRLIKTHECYRRVYKKAIYLVRDVRDVLLSAYAVDSTNGMGSYHCQGRGFDGYVDTFLRGKCAHQGSWQNHVNSWMDSPLARNGNLLLIRFEDMRKNTEATVSAVLKFLECNYDMDKVRAAIANNSLDRMRAKEENVKRSGVKLDKKVLIRTHTVETEDGRFVRKGAIGGWRAKLSESHVRLIEEWTGPTLLRMGYEVGSSVEATASVSA